MRKILFSVILYFSLLISFCGGSSDHPNSICIGKIVNTCGKPVAFAEVWLLPDGYNHFKDSADYYMKTYSDESGQVTFKNVPSGYYTISGQHRNDETAFMQENVSIDKTDTTLDRNFTLTSSGQLYIDADSLDLKPGDVLYLSGLPRYHLLGKEKLIKFLNLPTGNISLGGYDPVSGTEIQINNKTEASIISIASGQKVFITSKTPPFETSLYFDGDKYYGLINNIYWFNVTSPSISVGGEHYLYRFYWQADSVTEWKSNPTFYHSWSNPGYYSVRSQIMIINENKIDTLNWSTQLTVKIDTVISK